MLQRNNSYGVWMLHCNSSYGRSRKCCSAASVTVCVYCVGVGTAVYWRVGGTSEAMFPAPGAEPRRAAQARSKASAQQGDATRRRNTAAQHGDAARRRMGLVLYRRDIPVSYQSDW